MYLSERLVHRDPRASGEVEAPGARVGDHRNAHLPGHKVVEERLWETAYLVAKHEIVAR